MKLTRRRLRRIILETIQAVTEHYDQYSDDEFDRRRDYKAMGFNPNDPGLEDIYGSEDDYDPFDPTRPEYRDFESDEEGSGDLDQPGWGDVEDEWSPHHDSDMVSQRINKRKNRQLSLPFGK